MKRIFLLFVMMLFIPISISASEVDYEITNYYIEADVLQNGNMEVTELIVLDGTFNGYIRDIKYKNSALTENNFEVNSNYNAQGLELISVEAKKVNKINFDIINDNNFKYLNENQASNLGYVESKIKDGKSYKMYFKSDNDKVAFRIKYLLKDVVVVHNDIAELYWTFIGSEYDDKLRDVKIKVNLPAKDNSSNFRVWAHGELAGEVRKYDDAYILATVKSIDPYSGLDVRTTFDLSVINKELVNKKTNEVALSKIIEVEEKRAKIANEQRAEMKRKYNLVLSLNIIWYVGLTLAFIYIYLKYDKEYKSTFKSKYNREFIDDYNVEVIDYLFNKRITSNAMSASIMNLVYKKIIKVEEISGNKKKKDYIFHLLDESSGNEAEKYLIDFLFTKVGNGNSFTTISLKNYAKKTATCEAFSTSYTTWQNKVIEIGKKQDFYESKGVPKVVGVLFLILILLLNGFAIILNVECILCYISIIVAFIFLIYTLVFNKRTIKGNDHYVKWKAFKRFLDDFGTFELKELPEIVLWERYMVYATLFGLANKVSKVMNVHIKELQNSGTYVSGYDPVFTDWYIFHSINNAVNSTVQENLIAITNERANSYNSSGSGFGGGFSSGGGFGGGGGGGRGF